MKIVNGKILNRILRVAMISLIFVAAIAAIGIPTVKARPLGMLYVDPPYQEVPVCTNFTVKVNLTTAEFSEYVNFTLTFDPSLLECIDVTNDSFPPPDIKFQKFIDNTTGYVVVRIGAENEFNGSGTIADITFHCKGVGTSFLNFTQSIIIIKGVPYPDAMLLYNGTCNQMSTPVGGEVLAIDTPPLFIPWIAGVVVVAMALVLASRRTFNH